MTTILTIIHVLASIFLIAIVLLQQGKGADMGATFGGGSSQTVFGADGPVSLLSKITTAAAIIFMVTSLFLAYQTAHNNSGSVMSEIPVPAETKDAIEDEPQLIETRVKEEADGAAKTQDEAAADDAPATEAPTATESSDQPAPASPDEAPAAPAEK
ncbi:MAG: preprotein translocase subunit SecG [Thermodesulfobacteriota bacterium]